MARDQILLGSRLISKTSAFEGANLGASPSSPTNFLLIDGAMAAFLTLNQAMIVRVDLDQPISSGMSFNGRKTGPDPVNDRSSRSAPANFH